MKVNLMNMKDGAEEVEIPDKVEIRQLMDICPKCGSVDWTGSEEENPECCGCSSPYIKSETKQLFCEEGDIVKRELGSKENSRIVCYHSDTYEKLKKEWNNNPDLNGDKNELENSLTGIGEIWDGSILIKNKKGVSYSDMKIESITITPVNPINKENTK